MLQTNCFTLLAATLAFGCSSVKAQKNSDEAQPKPAPAAAAAQPKTEAAPAPAKPARAAAANTDKAPAATPAPALDAELAKALGEANLKAIQSADKVTLVEVSTAKVEDPKGTKTVQGHAVKGEEIALNAEAVKTLKGYLLDKESHRLGMRARCRFRPNHAFLFHQGDKATSVLYASKRNCPKWSFSGSPKRAIVDVKKSVSRAESPIERNPGDKK